jgi:hypothetical protein
MYYFPFSLKCSDLLIEETLNMLNKKWNFQSEFIVIMDFENENTLNEELSSRGLPKLLYATCFARGRDHTQGIHIDGGAYYEITNSSLNIPIIGCENTEMQWFEGDYKIEKRTSINDLGLEISYNIVKWGDQETIKVADSLELTTSHFVRVNTPHRAISNKEQPRAVLALRFYENLTIEDFYSRLNSG